MERNDTTLALTSRELDYLYAQRVQRYRPRLFRTILRVSNEAPQWADRIEVQKISEYGDIRPTFAGGSDKAMAPTLTRENNFLNVWEFEGYYEVRDSELARVQQLGNLGSLPVMLASANQTKTEEVLEEIAAIGSSAHSDWPTIPGLANNADAVTNKLTAGANWDDTVDPKDILGELHDAVDAVYIDTKQLYPADTLLLPVTSYRFIARRRLGDGTDMTILRAFEAAAPEVRRVMGWHPLETAGTGGIKRMIAMHSTSDESPTMFIPRELTDHEPARKRTSYEVGQTMRTGGVLIENHRLLKYTDGI